MANNASPIKLKKHLNDLQLAGEAIETGKHKRGLEVPFHNWPLLEVLGKVAMAIHVGVSVALADSESLLYLLNALLWLHAEDLLCHIIACLVSGSRCEEGVCGEKISSECASMCVRVRVGGW